MDEMSLLEKSPAAPWPTCPVCGEAHPGADGCKPEWRVVRIWDPVESSYTGPRYYVEPEGQRRTGT